jgi:hypothetical protein
MASLTQDLELLPRERRFNAKALWDGDHPSPLDGFLTNFLGGLSRNITHIVLDAEIMGWLAFFRSVDDATGKRRHQVLFPGLPWDDLLRRIGFDESAVKVWARAISENPDVSPEAVAKELRKLERARDKPARPGPGAPEGSRNAAKDRGKINTTNRSINFGSEEDREKINGSNTTINSDPDAKTLRRMKRDLPDLAQQVVNGEISLNAAAISAGFRKKKVQVEATPEGFARAIEKHLPGYRLVGPDD